MKEQLYSYDGPVLYFDNCITSSWKESTYAVSESKARSNLAYRFKKSNNMSVNAKINLPGKLIVDTNL